MKGAVLFSLVALIPSALAATGPTAEQTITLLLCSGERAGEKISIPLQRKPVDPDAGGDCHPKGCHIASSRKRILPYLMRRNEVGARGRDKRAMWPYYPELLSTPVPRYTSFPTAAEFGSGVGEADVIQALATASGDVSLYLHIPFCQEICWYCGCNTGRTNRQTRLASYIDALHREIALVGKKLSANARIRRIAFGGGSPNAIAPTDFVRLMVSLTQAFHLAEPEISVELDPRTLDEQWGEALAGVGVRRASLGVQTFSPEVQKAIGRVQPASMIERCMTILRDVGVSSLNFDLMYGLPGQSMTDLDETLLHATMLAADRIAVFGYAHVPHLVPRQKRIDVSMLPDQEARFRMAERTHDFLVNKGYTPIGFDHFALPGDPLAQATLSGLLHRNFQGFTDDTASAVIGLGASAISSFPQLLVQNEKNAGAYRERVAQNHLTAVRGIRRSGEDQRRAAIIEALLCHGKAAPGANLLEAAAAQLLPFLSRGLAVVEDGVLVIPPRGLHYARIIASIFDPYRAHSGVKVSSAV